MKIKLIDIMVTLGAWLADLFRSALRMHDWEYSEGSDLQYRRCRKCGQYEWAREDDWGIYWETIAKGGQECVQ